MAYDSQWNIQTPSGSGAAGFDDRGPFEDDADADYESFQRENYNYLDNPNDPFSSFSGHTIPEEDLEFYGAAAAPQASTLGASNELKPGERYNTKIPPAFSGRSSQLRDLY